MFRSMLTCSVSTVALVLATGNSAPASDRYYPGDYYGYGPQQQVTAYHGHGHDHGHGHHHHHGAYPYPGPRYGYGGGYYAPRPYVPPTVVYPVPVAPILPAPVVQPYPAPCATPVVPYGGYGGGYGYGYPRSGLGYSDKHFSIWLQK